MCADGMGNMVGCVLFGVPSEDGLRALADQYGWKTDEDLRFRGYVMPYMQMGAVRKSNLDVRLF